MKKIVLEMYILKNLLNFLNKKIFANMESCCNSPSYFNYGFSIKNSKICFINTHQFGIDYVLKITNGNIEMICYFVIIRYNDKLYEQNAKLVEYNDSLCNSIMALNTLYNYFKEIESNHHFYQHLVHNFTIEKSSKNSLLYKHFKRCFNFDPFMCYNFRVGFFINTENDQYVCECENSEVLLSLPNFLSKKIFATSLPNFLSKKIFVTSSPPSSLPENGIIVYDEFGYGWSECTQFIIYNEKYMQEIDLGNLHFEKNDMYSIDCDLLDYDGFLKFEYESLDVINPTLIFSRR